MLQHLFFVYSFPAVIIFISLIIVLLILWLNWKKQVKLQPETSDRVETTERIEMFTKYLIKDGTILKSFNDKKKYKLITLINGLRALLICDTSFSDRSPSPSPSSSSSSTSSEDTQDDKSEVSDGDVSVEEQMKGKKICGAALSVRVGTLSDPINIQGLAHLVEHVIFMGNKEYPEENSFEAFLNRKSGFLNAQTDFENTVYEFQVPNRYLQDSLKRFAAIFTSPLFRESSVENEIRPVDNEFVNSLGDDDLRAESLLSSLTQPDHELSKFSFGNVESLIDHPKAEGIDLNEAIKKFWSTYYHASNMNLVVQGEYDLETLEKWVTEYFVDIPRTPETFQPTMSQVNETSNFPYAESKFCKLFYIEPVASGDYFYINFWLPPKFNCYKSKPLSHFGSLLGHEGKGSLFSILKKRGYALEIIAGNHENGFDANRFQALFSIQVKLTPSGLQNLDSIVDYIWSFIDYIKAHGPQDEHLEEDMAVRLYSFAFANEKSGCRNCVKIARNMTKYDTEHILTGSKLLFEIDKDKIQAVFPYLSPSRANYIVFSKNLFTKTELPVGTEKWYGTKYKTTNIPTRWINYQKPHDFDAEVHFPLVNDFIANNFEVLQSEITDYPKCLDETQFWKLWFKGGTKYEVPKVCVKMIFRSPFARSNPQTSAALELYIRALVMKAEEDVYPASLAGLDYNIGLHDSGLYLSFSGFSDKVSKFVLLIVNHLVTLDVDDNIFSNIRRDLCNDYYNSFTDSSELSASIRLSILKPNFAPPYVKRLFLPSLTREIAISVGRQLLANSFLECFVSGNITPTEALSIVDQVSSITRFKHMFQYATIQDRVSQLPPGHHICRVLSFSKEEKSSMIVNYYQFEPVDFKTGIIIELLNSTMSEQLFDTLRTQEGLGYEVYSSHQQTYGVGGLTVTVVSDADKFDCSYINSRIEAFLAKFSAKLVKMEEDEFEELVNGLLKIKSAPFLTLNEESKFFWNEILEKRYLFDKIQREIDALTELTLSEFIIWSYLHLLDTSHRKKLSIQIVANGSKALEESLAIESNPFTDPNVVSSEMGCISEVSNSKITSDIDEDFLKNRDCSHLLKNNKRPIDEEDKIYVLKHLAPKNIKSDTKLIVDIEEFKRYLPIYPKIRKIIR